MLVTDGMMMVRHYVDANTQEKKTYTYVRVDDFEFVETKGTAKGTTLQGTRVQVAGATRVPDTVAEGRATSASGPVPVAAQPSFFEEFGTVEVLF